VELALAKHLMPRKLKSFRQVMPKALVWDYPLCRRLQKRTMQHSQLATKMAVARASL